MLLLYVPRLSLRYIERLNSGEYSYDPRDGSHVLESWTERPVQQLAELPSKNRDTQLIHIDTLMPPFCNLITIKIGTPLIHTLEI